MGITDEMRAAVGSLTGLGGDTSSTSPEALAGGLAFYPLVGFGLGVLAAAVAAAVDNLAPEAAGAAGVLTLLLCTRARGTGGLMRAIESPVATGSRALGVGTAVAALAARVAALSALTPAARGTALAVAPMLGAWAVVVQCYGGMPGHAGDPAAAMIGRARFREFGWASVTALGVTLAIGDAVGLVLVIGAAGVTVAVRVLAYRRLGGLTESVLAGTRELVETVVLVTLGCLVRLSR